MPNASEKYTVLFENGGDCYKLCKIIYGPDGSYYVTSPYHPSKEAVLAVLTVNYALSEMEISLEEAIDLASVDDDARRLKLSHHPDGLVHFSGQGIVSGKDSAGNIRGIGVMSWPLDEPAPGPAFSLSMFGLERFERANKIKDTPLLFTDAEIASMPGPNVFALEGYYLPALWRRFVRVKEDGSKTISLSHPAGAVLELKVIFPPEHCALQNFIGLELYTYTAGPESEGLTSGFALSGSKGKLRKNAQGETFADGIFCVYPRRSATLARRSLNFQSFA